MAKVEQRVVSGRCPNHGIVQATKTVPAVSFPWVINSIRRALASSSPAACPQCGAKLGRA